MSGLELLRGMIEGRFPGRPIMQLMDFGLVGSEWTCGL